MSMECLGQYIYILSLWTVFVSVPLIEYPWVEVKEGGLCQLKMTVKISESELWESTGTRVKDMSFLNGELNRNKRFLDFMMLEFT